LSFDYYSDSLCNTLLVGTPGYPNDGTYHTTPVTATSPCVTFPNDSNNVWALSCTPNQSGGATGASISAASQQSAVNEQHGILAAFLMAGAGIAAATALSNVN
jgi:hypothetical protein